MQHSVIRRSLAVTTVFVAGHLFNYALMFTANRLLDANTFGRFYAAISLLNVLLTPANILTFMLAQHFASIFRAGGTAAVAGELGKLLRSHSLVGGGGVVLTALSLLLLGLMIGADAGVVLVMVPTMVLAVYLFEMARAALQGSLDFVAYGAAWIGWCGSQYILAATALYVFGAAWAGIAGLLVATVIVTLVLFLVIFRRAAASDKTPAVERPPFRVWTAIPFAIQYGFFILLTNLDILLAYLVLSGDDLGVYAATSVLPKAIVTATLPVSQVMLPVMASSSGERRPQHQAFIKAIAVCAAMGVAGATVLWAGGDLACNDRIGIRFCSTPMLTVLSLSAIPLALIRVLVVAGLAVDRHSHILAPAFTLVVFGLTAKIFAHAPERLAVMYAVLCWLLLAIYPLANPRTLQLATERG
jgi:O-antigen/teichoic acid export membrane protein